MQKLSGPTLVLYFVSILTLLAALLYASVTANNGISTVVVSIDGPIGPATSDYFQRSLEKSISSGASLVILKMNTPGGLDSAMRDIIKSIITSPIPVVTYVAPGGSRAASAGTYILYASHLAAMAPATNLGAATPVQVGGLPALPSPKKPAPTKPSPAKEWQQPDNPEILDNKNAMRHKVVNDSVAYIRGLAELRKRNAEWAEAAVRQAVSLTASEALKQNVIDVVAADLSDLLQQINGKEIFVAGEEVELNTNAVTITEMQPDWRTKFLSIITNPNVAYILMLIGIYGLIFEFSSPGAILPGVVGGICLLLALFSFQALPINYAGLALMILGTFLMVGEAFVPSFGALGIGGVIAFVLGSILLIDTDSPAFGVSPVLVLSISLISSLLFLVIIIAAVKSRRKQMQTGMEAMVGELAVVLDDFENKGQVRVVGEIWNARSHQPLKKDQEVTVKSVDGLTLTVSPKSK